MKKFEMNISMTNLAATIAAVICLTPTISLAQIGNPWNTEAEANSATYYPAPVLQILTAQATTSRYAPADLEQRLSAVKPAMPIARPPVPQSVAPQSTPMQQNPYAAGQQYNAPQANNYQGNGYPPAYGYGAPQQGYNGYPPNYGQGGYNNYGAGMPFGSGGNPGGFGGFMPSTGGFPGVGASPFNISPFGFFGS